MERWKVQSSETLKPSGLSPVSGGYGRVPFGHVHLGGNIFNGKPTHICCRLPGADLSPPLPYLLCTLLISGPVMMCTSGKCAWAQKMGLRGACLRLLESSGPGKLFLLSRLAR